jgi:hypothetical protein
MKDLGIGSPLPLVHSVVGEAASVACEVMLRCFPQLMVCFDEGLRVGCIGKGGGELCETGFRDLHLGSPSQCDQISKARKIWWPEELTYPTAVCLLYLWGRVEEIRALA